MINIRLFLFATFALASISNVVLSQNNVGINTTSPNSNAALDVRSKGKQGFQMPRLVANDTLVPPLNSASLNKKDNGLMFYDTVGVQFLYFNGSNWHVLGAGSGSAGTKGLDGKTVLSGVPDPVSTTGTNGDFYINTTSSKIFGPKASGTWPAGVNLVGPAGTNGANGTNGKDGTNGTNGLDGRTVLNGASDPVSTTGANGDFYINSTSSKIFGPKAAGTWPTGVNLVGSAGTNGSSGSNGTNGTNGTNGLDGRTVLSGVSDPVSTTGTNGDFYINTTSSKIFGPKAAGSWPTGVNLVGSAGTNGSSGTDGTNGTNGLDGRTVLSGVSDPVSTTGTNGDFYINTTSNKIFGPKAAGIWPTGVNLVGPAGSSDNLGNHTATQNIILGSNYLSGDGGNEGIKIDALGNVGIGINPATPTPLFVYRPSSAFGPGTGTIIAYRSGGTNAGDGGSSWSYNNADGAMRAINFGSNNYSAGVYGSSPLTVSNNAGVVGTNSGGTIFGALAYNDGTTSYGLYTPDRLYVGGTSTLNGVVTIGNTLRLPTGAGLNKVLTSDALGNASWQALSTVAIGTGTQNYISKWNNTPGTTLVNSIIYDNGTNVGIGTASPQNKLDVEGGMVIGTTYAGVTAAPINGLLVQGNVGLGIANPLVNLAISGAISYDQLPQMYASDGGLNPGDHTYIRIDNQVSTSITSISNGLEIGQMLIIEYIGNNSLTIRNNGNTKMATDFTMDIDDIITFIWNGSDWIEISRRKN